MNTTDLKHNRICLEVGDVWHFVHNVLPLRKVNSLAVIKINDCFSPNNKFH